MVCITEVICKLQQRISVLMQFSVKKQEFLLIIIIFLIDNSYGYFLYNNYIFIHITNDVAFTSGIIGLRLKDS